MAQLSAQDIEQRLKARGPQGRRSAYRSFSGPPFIMPPGVHVQCDDLVHALRADGNRGAHGDERGQSPRREPGACIESAGQIVGDDGIIGIDEFLSVLGQWGAVPANTPCDFDGNLNVGIDEFLKVLGLWGPCP